MTERRIRTQILRSGGKELLVTSVNLHDKHSMATLPAAVSRIFEELAPFAKNKRQIAYIRDHQDLASRRLRSNDHPNDEMFVSLPDWRTERRGIVDAFAEELHVLVRQQLVGAPRTLGDRLTAEAMARVYAERTSGVPPRWSRGSVSQQIYDRARSYWSKELNDTEAGLWFSKSPLGAWVGYKLAYRLGTQFFADGFNLKRSLTAMPNELKSLL